MANEIALRFDREGRAEMSCIAGVGGGVPVMVRKARSGREIIALDGCPLCCVKSCLNKEGVSPSVHETLSDYGVRKQRCAFDAVETDEVMKQVIENVEATLNGKRKTA
jgi:uncharacterized metal-binding protein